MPRPSSPPTPPPDFGSVNVTHQPAFSAPPTQWFNATQQPAQSAQHAAPTQPVPGAAASQRGNPQRRVPQPAAARPAASEPAAPEDVESRNEILDTLLGIAIMLLLFRVVAPMMAKYLNGVAAVATMNTTTIPTVTATAFFTTTATETVTDIETVTTTATATFDAR
jgi:hypothetical protein